MSEQKPEGVGESPKEWSGGSRFLRAPGKLRRLPSSKGAVNSNFKRLNRAR